MKWILLAVLAAAAACVAAETPELRYVAGSRVNLRREPQPGGAVVGLLVANTPVQLVAQKGAWCEVRATPAGAAPLAGHVACNLLAREPLKIDDLEAAIGAGKGRDGAMPGDLLARAFWVSPSLERFERYAYNVPVSKPGPDEAYAVPRVLPNPEYDAIKAFLSTGRMKVDRPQAWLAAAPSVMASAGATALVRAPLPPAQPSFFATAADFDAPVPSGWLFGGGDPMPHAGQDAGDAAPYGWADSAAGDGLRLLDHLAHRAGAALKVVPTSEWSVDRNDELVGAGGIGSLRVELAPAATIQTVDRTGTVGTLAVAGATYRWGAGACSRGGSDIVKPPRPGGAPGMEHFLVAWSGRKPPGTQATVLSRQLDGRTRYDRLLVHRIDVDGDRRPDFVVYEGRYQPQATATGLWTAVYANVAGRWLLVHEDTDDDCT